MKFGLLCAPASHTHAFISLGRALQKLGHDVLCINIEDVRSDFTASGLDFVSYPPPAETFYAQKRAQLARASRFAAARMTRELGLVDIECQLRAIPALVKRHSVEVLVVDKASPAGGTIADLCGIPFVTVIHSLMEDLCDEWPPVGFAWRYSSSRWAKIRNRIGNELHRYFARSLVRRLNETRIRSGLWRYRTPGHWSSSILQIVGMPQEFELPRQSPHRQVYVGPLANADDRPPPPSVDWTCESRARPIVYATLGTLVNDHPMIYRTLIEAAAGLDVFMIISLGKQGMSLAVAPPENVRVVSYLKQTDVLGHARLCICQAGITTVMESLACGVPVLALPIANDQPGIAERIRFHGLGHTLSISGIKAADVRASVTQMLSDTALHRRSQAAKLWIRDAGRAGLAAQLIVDRMSAYHA